MKEKFYKGYKKGTVKVVENTTTEEVLDFKGEKYQQKENKIDIFSQTGEKIVSVVEGNVLLLEGSLERQVEATIHFNSNFFAVCVKKEEYDKIMGILEEESYFTELYTYKGLHIERQGFWANNPAQVDAYSIKADFLNRGREEVEKKFNSEDDEEKELN